MAILIDKSTRIIVQGVTGYEGSLHAGRMLAAGGMVLAGVTPGKGGQNVNRLPVYGSVAEAVAEHQATASVVFVPAASAPLAILEAADAGLRLIVVVTEGIPVRDMVQVVAHLAEREVTLIGPNCPGVLTVGQSSAGIMPSKIFRPGPVGVVSRSGTLSYEIVAGLSRAGIGQTTCVGIGGDPVHGIGFTECLELFEHDDATRVIMLIGEIGGDEEERAAEYIRRNITKPVVAYVAGFALPPARSIGHAGAIIGAGSGSAGSAGIKASALESAGVSVARRPAEVATFVKLALAGGM